MATAEAPRSGGGGGAAANGREVLVVEDSRTTRELICRRLTRLGYETIACEDGVAALEMLDRRQFDLVLLDMVMPRMSGLSTLRALRTSIRHDDMPVIMMTARSDPGAAIEALELGADDHISKPFDFAVLAARIRRQLRRAAMIGNLRRSNAQLDARVAARIAEMGMLRAQLAASHVDRSQLVDAVAFLRNEVQRLSA